MVTFGENIYLWRLFRGLSQDDLAKKADIPRPNLSAIESGKREVTLTTLRSLAKALGTTSGIIVEGIPPVNLREGIFSREALEDIVKISLGGFKKQIAPEAKIISVMLSRIIQNKINASNKKPRGRLINRQEYINNWLMLKAAIGTEVLSNLLVRLDKHIGLGRKLNEQETN